MAEEDKDKSPHMDTDKTDEEAQDIGLAFDDDFTIEEDDCVFMVMVHLVDPHHFVCASSMVSGCLAEAYAKNSKLKGFEDIVLTSLHAYADIFSETAFDSLPEHHKWDHAIELEREPSPKQGLPDDTDRADRDGCLPRKSTSHWTHQTPLGALVFFIKKKDRKLRFVQDY
jgi:hypothetical protein